MLLNRTPSTDYAYHVLIRLRGGLYSFVPFSASVEVTDARRGLPPAYFPNTVADQVAANWYRLVFSFCSATGAQRGNQIIHVTPNRSETIPKLGEKNVFVRGICTFPPLAKESNSL